MGPATATPCCGLPLARLSSRCLQGTPVAARRSVTWWQFCCVRFGSERRIVSRFCCVRTQFVFNDIPGPNRKSRFDCKRRILLTFDRSAHHAIISHNRVLPEDVVAMSAVFVVVFWLPCVVVVQDFGTCWTSTHGQSLSPAIACTCWHSSHSS